MASRRTLSATAAAIAIALVAPRASADPTAAEKELARDLMQKGRDARQAHDDATALKSFKAADDIMHVPTTGFEVARSLADLGKLVEAHEALLRVSHIPERPDDSQGFKDARGYARTLDDDVVKRLAQLRITVQGATPEAVRSITVDGVAIPPGAMLVPYKVDPGHHVVVVTTTDGSEGRAEVDVRERDDKPVVAGVVASARPAATSPATAPLPDTPPPDTGAPTGSRGLGTVTWIGLGLAGAGLVAGGVTGALVLSDKSSIAAKCNGTRCPASENDALSSANTMATVSTISFAVAGAGVVLAAVGFFALRPAAPAATGARVVPWVGLGGAGVDGTF